VDGFKSLVIPSHLRPPAQAINWIALSGDPAVDAAMQVSRVWRVLAAWVWDHPPSRHSLLPASLPVQSCHLQLLEAYMHTQQWLLPPQRQVAGALEAIREVLAQLRERIEEQGLEAEVRGACSLCRPLLHLVQLAAASLAFKVCFHVLVAKHICACLQDCIAVDTAPATLFTSPSTGHGAREGAGLPAHQSGGPLGPLHREPPQGAQAGCVASVGSPDWCLMAAHGPRVRAACMVLSLLIQTSPVC